MRQAKGTHQKQTSNLPHVSFKEATKSEQQDEEEWEFHSEFFLLATPHWGFTLDVTLMEIDMVNHRQRHKMFSPPTNQWDVLFARDFEAFDVICAAIQSSSIDRMKRFRFASNPSSLCEKVKHIDNFGSIFCVSESGIRPTARFDIKNRTQMKLSGERKRRRQNMCLFSQTRINIKHLKNTWNENYYDFIFHFIRVYDRNLIWQWIFFTRFLSHSLNSHNMREKKPQKVFKF